MTSTSAPSSSSTTTTTSTTTASNASGTGAAGSVHRTSSTHHHSSSSTSSTSSAKGSQQQTSGVSPSFAGISANITSTSALPASSLVAATTSSSTSGGSHNASSSSATSGSGSANKHHSTSALINTLNFTELLALANLPPETRVPVVNVESGLRLTGDEAPKVKNLGQWLSAHPKFVLDIPSGADTAHRSSSHTATATASTPTSTSKHSNDKSSSSSSEKKTSSSSDRLIAGSGSRSKDDTSVTRHSSRSDQSKDASSSKAVASKSSTTALSLEPGEIPKPSCSSSSAAASSTSLGIGSLAEQPVAVFDRTSGQLLSADRWPSIRSLASWLDKHPDCNVHSSSATLAAAVLSKRYNDRLGGEANILAAAAAALNATSSGIGGGASSSASSLEALQMQLMLQQALMNPSLLSLGGLCGYSPLNPYAMLAAATTTSPSVSSSKLGRNFSCERDSMSKRELLSSNQLYHSNDGITNRAWCVRWNHKGDVLASCGDDKNIKLWKLTEDAPPYVKYSSTLSGSHSRTIRSVAFSPSDQMLASCGFDAAIVLYELIDNEYTEVGKLEGHENEVKCCAFSPSGEFLASCSRDKSVWFWQLDEDEDFQVASILQPHTQDVKFVVWHPNEELLVSCSYDCSIKFFKYDGDDWITQQKIDSAHGSTVWSADFSADGESLVTVGGDSVIKIWERVKRNMPITSSHWHCVCSYKADTRWPLYTVSWNHFNNIIAVGGGDQNLRLLRVEEGAGDGQMRTLVEYGAKRKFASEINSLAWNPHDANLLALAEDTGQIHIVNLVDM